MTIRQRPFRYNKEELTTGERATYTQIANEAIDLFGVDVVYYPISHSDPTILGETNKEIQQGVNLRFGLQQLEEDFGDEEGSMFSKFGVDVNFGSATFSSTQEYLDFHNVQIKEDDLILYKKRNLMFQITNIDEIKSHLVIRSVPYNYDHTAVDPLVQEQEVKDLEQIEDQEEATINAPQRTNLDNDTDLQNDLDDLFF